MHLEINKEIIEKAIQDHLDKAVKDGIDYRVKDAINKAIADSITPEIVSGYTDAAIKALTDPKITERIILEMQDAIAEGVRITLQETIISMICKIRAYNPSRNKEDEEKVELLRKRLFPN